MRKKKKSNNPNTALFRQVENRMRANGVFRGSDEWEDMIGHVQQYIQAHRDHKYIIKK